MVANASSKTDPALVIAALLHDTIEDAGVTHPQLVEQFGQDVADLVFELTDDKTLPKSERKRLQVENAFNKSVRAGFIKLADKISNLRAILYSPPSDWSFGRRQEYFIWAKQVVESLPEPNPLLKAEFDRLQREFENFVRLSKRGIDEDTRLLKESYPGRRKSLCPRGLDLASEVYELGTWVTLTTDHMGNDQSYEENASMPWKEFRTSDERLKFIAQLLSSDTTIADLCRQFGVSRKTGYKMKKRYEAGGPTALVDLSRRPHSHPGATPAIHARARS